MPPDKTPSERRFGREGNTTAKGSCYAHPPENGSNTRDGGSGFSGLELGAAVDDTNPALP